MTVDVDTVVVGAGVVSLAIAQRLSTRGREVMVLERNAGIGQETSSRSSEVIHAGIYYTPGTLKALLCIEGNKLLYEFARESGVAVRRTGKLIVATSDSECAKLQDICRIATLNGVKGLELLTAAEARVREPELACVAAIYVPSTGIVDSNGLIIALAGLLQSCGGSIIFASLVEKVYLKDAIFELSVSNGAEVSSLTCRNLVLSAGRRHSGRNSKSSSA